MNATSADAKSPFLRAIAAIRAWCEQSPVLAIGVLGWLLVAAFYWPEAFSFADELGYVGEAKLLLAGRVFPLAQDPGIWVRTARGLVAQYPLLGSILMAPLVALTPKAVFALGLAAAVVLCLMAARVLRSWETDSAWALLLLAHPSIVILSRTATVDIAMVVFMFWVWLAMREDRRFMVVLAMIALCLIKPTGFVLGALLAGGDFLRLFPRLRRADREAWGHVLTSGIGLALGLLAVAASNELSAGQLWFAYDLSLMNVPPFSWSNLSRTGPAHLRTLLLFPPLLVMGSLPFFRRREIGPLCVIFGFGALMGSYFFVDFGTTRFESLVLAPRLLLPVVAFLLVGYAHLLSAAARRLKFDRMVVQPILLGGTLLVVFGVSFRHHRWQMPMAAARDAAVQIANRVGTNELAFFPQAAKTGLLFPGKTRLVAIGEMVAPVVLCTDRSSSYRSQHGGQFSCDLPGYRSRYRSGDFFVLVQEGLLDKVPR